MTSLKLADVLEDVSISDDSEDIAPPSLPPAEQYYIDKSRTMLSLATMSIGAFDDDKQPLIDPDAAPWNKLPKKQVKPSLDLLRAEIKRRWETEPRQSTDLSKEPASKNWDKNKLMKWLHEHPITLADDVAFLKTEVANRKRAAINAVRETDKEADQLLALDGAAKKNKSWSGRLPYLRLIHALIDHDNIKAAYIRRGDIPSGRMAVENRNTEEAKAASVWQMMADKWNDDTFAPATACEPDWHPHFASSQTITYEMVSDFLPPNAEKVKERFESMMTVLKRTIPKWERSGQGDGGHHGNDDDDNPLNDQEDIDTILDDDDIDKEKPGFGVLAGRSKFALSKIQDFFENHNSYVIYLWHMIAKHQLITSSMNMLADGVGSRSGARGIPSAISATRTAEDEDDGSSVMSKSFSSIPSAKKDSDSGDHLSKSIREHATRLRDFAIAKEKSSVRQIKHEEEKQKRKRYNSIQLELGRLRAEKRQHLIHQRSIQPGSQPELVNALAESIAEVEEEIAMFDKELSEVDIQTPQKSNRSPDC